MGIKAVGTMATSEFLQALLEELIPDFYSVQTNNVECVRLEVYCPSLREVKLRS